MDRKWKIFIITSLVLVIAFAHYFSQFYWPDRPHLHNMFIKFFYIPILLSAYWWGLIGGSLVAVLCAIIYGLDIPLWWSPHHPRIYEEIVEISLFLIVGVLLGSLVDSDRRSKQEKIKADQLAQAEFQRAITDPLTKAFNRRYMDRMLEEIWNKAKQGDQTFSLLMMDLDRFKSINDDYGHPVGDQVLRSTAEILLNNSRRTDSLFRYGGDEFLLLLPQTSGELAFILAQRLKEEVEKLTFLGSNNTPFKANLSIGVVEYQTDFKNIGEMLTKLDETLYKAKKEEAHVSRAN